jgi:hypothetical protein
MRKPSGLRGFVGRPIITAPILGTGSFCLYLWYLHQDAAVLGLAALWVMGWTLNANARVAQYRTWQRAWDSMGPEGAPRPAADHPAVRVGALVAIAAGVGFYLYRNGNQPGFQFAQAWLGLGLGALLLVGLAYLGHRTIRSFHGSQRRPATRQATVAICVDRPIYPVPNLKGAFGALPAHCWRVLGVPGA